MDVHRYLTEKKKKKKSKCDHEPVRVQQLRARFPQRQRKRQLCVCLCVCERTRASRVNWMTSRGSEEALYSIFSCSFLWKHTGRIETTARTASTASEYQDTASPAVVSLYSVVPAFIATKDGGATPEREMRERTQKPNPT